VVQGVSTAVQLTAGANHTCALLADQTVRCWGAGELGQLGWGALRNHEIPSKVMGLTSAVQVAAGDGHTCARTSPDGRPETAGAAVCWGDNHAGQLGNGTRQPDRGTGPSVQEPLLNGDALELAAGSLHTCAIKRDRSVVCWGSNSAGQLGDGITLQYPIAQPTRIACP